MVKDDAVVWAVHIVLEHSGTTGFGAGRSKKLLVELCFLSALPRSKSRWSQIFRLLFY